MGEGLDLGREPVTIVIDGLLFGTDALSSLETLRQAHAKAEPQSFAADLVVGTDLTEVVIEDFRVRQLAGYRDRFRFSLRLREHIEPPQASDAAMADVNAGVATDAAAWGDGSLAAAGVLQDPASLAAALSANPALLEAAPPATPAIAARTPAPALAAVPGAVTLQMPAWVFATSVIALALLIGWLGVQ